MRQAITDAQRTSPVPSQDVAFPRGSIVVCYSCGIPLYKLEAAIFVGEKATRSGWKYAPVSVNDLRELVARRDLDPGIRASLKLLTAAQLHEHCAKIQRLHAGDALDCAACRKPFVFVRTSDGSEGALEFTDRAYVIQLATIPPVGQARPLTLAGRRR
jgi:hypothetical protein